MKRILSNPQDIDIKRSQRVFFVGKTGSGKTSLAKALLYGQEDIIILDPKHTFELPTSWQHEYYKDMGKLTKHKGTGTAIYRPSLDEMDKGCDAFFFWIFERRNTIVYVDEVIRVTNGYRIFPGYQQVLQLGRERNVGCWSATQRPASVPRAVITESEHDFIFRLSSKDDRRTMVDYVGYEEVLEIPEDEHGFYYYNDTTGKLIYYGRANLGRVSE